VRDTAVWDQALSLGYNNTDSRFAEAYYWTTYFGGVGGVTGVLEKYNLNALILPADSSPGLPRILS
jgi:amidase